jgi:hypothetical protein
LILNGKMLPELRDLITKVVAEIAAWNNSALKLIKQGAPGHCGTTLMTYETELPEPLQVKLASWNLPSEVEADFLELLYSSLSTFPASPYVRIVPYEITVCFEGTLYEFCGRIEGRIFDNKLLLTNCNFDIIVR